jgi:hypothetical protein
MRLIAKIAVLTLALMTAPVFGKKPPKASPVQTQPNIVKGCITVHDITFDPAHGFHSGKLSALVQNACGREVSVTIFAGFYRNGEEVPASSLFTPVSGSKELLTEPGETIVEWHVVNHDGIHQARIMAVRAGVP